MALDQVESILRSAVRANITPGACASYGFMQGSPKRAAAGKLSNLMASPKANFDTIYDLASLTKVLSTTLIAAFTIDNGKLDLWEKPWKNWPGVSIFHVMTHSSGLPAWSPFYLQFATCKEILAAVHATPLVTLPGLETIYSDIGFIALGALLEQRLGDTLDVIFADLRTRYFPDSKLTYINLKKKRPFLLNNVAPTGSCDFRNRIVRGEADDLNCFAMGGVSGHAGLFGSLKDVEQAVCWFTRALSGDPSRMASLIRDFAKAPTPRGVGFDRPTNRTNTGHKLSSHAVGHLGFTGTSFWIEPHQSGMGTYTILLTNRVEIDRTPKGIRRLRTAFQDTAADLLANLTEFI